MAVPKEVTFTLSHRRSSVPRARAILHAMLGGWPVERDLLDTAELVLSELVTNALRVRVVRNRQVGVRIVHLPTEGVLRLEVSDGGKGRPEVRNPSEDETGGRGLLLVEALTHRWGVQAEPGGLGKTVWAELKAPGIAAAEPTAREVAAVTLQPGQQVRVNDQWHEVRSVRGARCLAGTYVVLLGLDDDGPLLRVDATEPLTVRDGGRSPS